MADPTIKIEGVEEIERKFGKIPPAVKAAIKATGMKILGHLKGIYPKEIEGSTYTRTKKLAKSWNLRETDDGAGVVIGSSTDAVPYNRIVMDREEQAFMHLFGGWHTVQDVAEEYGPQVNDMVHDAIEQALK